MARKKKEFGYDMDNVNDKAMIMDLPFTDLNRKGRKAKKHYLKLR